MAYYALDSEQPNIEHDASSSPRRFNRFFNSVLGSPFVTTSDLPQDALIVARLAADDELEAIDGAFSAVPRAETVTRPPSPSPSFSTDTYSFVNWTENADFLPLQSRPSVSDDTPACAFLAGPSRRLALQTHSSEYAYTPYNSLRGSTSSSVKMPRSVGILPRIWEVLRESSPAKKGKRRLDIHSNFWDKYNSGGYIDYTSLPPLDGEEGELIDDEACFIDVQSVRGLDILAQVPYEVAIHILTFLDLPDINACTRVSRLWNRLAADNAVWHSLFARRREQGWLVDLRRVNLTSLPDAAVFAYSHIYAQSRSHMAVAPLELDWRGLYTTRVELDRRWSGRVLLDGGIEDKENARAWEPRIRRLLGHSDSVYCVEFDSSKIITGSRDRTIKVWSLKTGRCLATFPGHRGSVLCLKFELDFDLDAAHAISEEAPNGWRKGLLVSGSSDCSVGVWDLYCHPAGNNEEMAITAEMRGILRGHTGGVLDLRIEQNWIISCGKDAAILMWDRNTLRLQRSFRGHEGPVNAVGVQGSRLVSASGDGKMILWDITTGERLRTFEAHDRGLACIEFKGGFIISGSNDCKIKIWDASSGECLRTLVGHVSLVRTLSFEPLSSRLVSGSYDRTIKVWDVKTGKMVREYRNLHLSHIFDIKFDCCRIVSVSHDQQIVVLDFTDGLDASLFV